MSLDIIDFIIILIGAIIGVVTLSILKFGILTEQKKDYKKYSTFFLMGLSWSFVGLIFEIFYRGESVLDSTLFSFGLIFLFAGGIGVILEYLRKN
jgi:branched-subunit amino acid transport protein AzlD